MRTFAAWSVGFSLAWVLSVPVYLHFQHRDDLRTIPTPAPNEKPATWTTECTGGIKIQINLEILADLDLSHFRGCVFVVTP